MAKVSQLTNTLDVLISVLQPGMIWGQPGVGKSDMIRQAAKRHKLRFIDIRLSQLDPVDLRGLPYVENNIAHFAPPAMLPQKGEPPALVFLDEMAQAPQLVQNAASELLLDRKLGEYELPEGCVVMAASNRKSDRAATVDMPTHLKNRVCHMELEANLEDWMDWALKNDILPEITGFLRFRPNHLCEEPDPKVQAFATPRTWAFLSKALPFVKPGDSATRFSLASGLVGAGPTSEFMAYCDIFQTLPDVDAILRNPEGKEHQPPVGKPNVMYALCAVLARRCNEKTHSNFFKYLARIPVEFQVCCLHDTRSAWPDVKKTPGYGKWANAHADLLLS